MKGTFMKHYEQALQETDSRHLASFRSGSAEEEKSLQVFRDFYRAFSEDKIRGSLADLYSREAYFRDGFREVRGIDAIESYFLSSTESFHECTFDIQDVAENGGNYYFRWVMTLVLKRDKDNPLRAVGMSHVRFDDTGKIIFHQDYWDTSLVYEQVPLLGRIITWIRSRI